MKVFEVKDVNVVLGEKTVLRSINFDIAASTIIAVVGPNGSGKTTLVRLMSRTLRPTAGSVLFKGTDLFALPTRQVAQSLAVLPQVRHAPHGLTVQMLAVYGRFPHCSRFHGLTGNDHEIVEWALQRTHMTHLRDRPLSRLSGGEQQRAWIAMALAQKPDVLVLDEPTTFLDIAYQLEILELLRTLNRESGLTIIMVLHDLNHALRYADSVMLVNDGVLKAVGAGKNVLTVENLNSEFCIDGDILWDKRNECPFIVPHMKVHHKDVV